MDPSHVRNQTESFAEVFFEHELKYKDDVEGMGKVSKESQIAYATSKCCLNELVKDHEMQGRKWINSRTNLL